MTERLQPIVIEDVTDTAELADARAQRKQFDRNAAWLQANLMMTDAAESVQISDRLHRGRLRFTYHLPLRGLTLPSLAGEAAGLARQVHGVVRPFSDQKATLLLRKESLVFIVSADPEPEERLLLK